MRQYKKLSISPFFIFHLKGTIFCILFYLTEPCISQISTAKDTINHNKNVQETPEILTKLIEKIKSTSQNQSIGLEIDGLLIDESKTKSGKDFYELFYQKWIAPENIHDYSIFINEKPYRLSTTQIEIQINENIVFQSLLQPKGDIIEALVEQALGQTHMYLQNYDEIIQNLDGEERTGNGIY